ncbi:TIGR01906 family membrane protein [Parasporobacterium paucivorans]|uniref:Integral membrane protein TIGR01906 n=1 Tax=Parasporobacterium paucivorans DSM 15970 TaxID=1122934 RepID=A0A1M6FKA0_9FIRM|nr:TIGR01906 family membrane protein [Parasporobacterium paucivorans]SHI98114.1 integral membrane protein TIGR01906 [Parasporobacterium paucivorans DSM 15970]
MNMIRWMMGGIFALALIIVTLVTSFEAALYSGLAFYEREYTKYDVARDVDMEMKDILYVTDEMMKYLVDDRDDLMIETVIAGEKGYFFNDREISHMEDVKLLFAKGLLLRSISLIVMAVCLLVLVLLRKRPVFVLSRCIKYGIITFAILVAALGAAMWADFNKVFTLFHKIFFTNDLWILNPETDRLINILPEGFFLDTVVRIGIIFGCSMVIILILSIVVERVIIGKKNTKEH